MNPVLSNRKELTQVMDYELMMNRTVRIGQNAPDFDATTTMGPILIKDYR